MLVGATAEDTVTAIATSSSSWVASLNVAAGISEETLSESLGRKHPIGTRQCGAKVKPH